MNMSHQHGKSRPSAIQTPQHKDINGHFTSWDKIDRADIFIQDDIWLKLELLTAPLTDKERREAAWTGEEGGKLIANSSSSNPEQNVNSVSHPVGSNYKIHGEFILKKTKKGSECQKLNLDGDMQMLIFFFSSLGPCLQVGLGLKWCECDLGIYCMYRCVFVCVW